MPDAPPRPRRTFGPVVLAGLVGSGLASVAGHKVWGTVTGAQDDSLASAIAASTGSEPGRVPLAGALALVGLAAWGVVLVTRGRTRRIVAALAGLAALGVVIAWAYALLTLQDTLSDTWRGTGDTLVVAFTGWFWATLPGALLALVAALAAVRLAPSWPEMGRRYDAPTAGSQGAAAEPSVALDRDHSLDVWKALDEGHDPTGSAERPAD